MSDADRPATLRYLQAPRGSFWAWDDDGRRVAWRGGQTIAFRAELLAVLRHLADAKAGLPPFAAVVLLLAATRDGWAAVESAVAAHAERLADSGGGDASSAVGLTLQSIGHRLLTDTAAVVAALNAVANLPAELRHPTAAKATLAEVVFDRATKVADPPAAAVVAELEAGTDPAAFDPVGTNTAVREWVDVLDALRFGLGDVTADHLTMRARTGLDAPVRPAAIDLGPTDRARRLLSEPTDDPDLSAVTKLARGLLAAVAVPRPVGTPDDRPAGGVSDLSNRGPLDRLLLTELAHDDLTLAVRVAVNQALYLQRETPPREPPRRRVLLVDTGLRTWGVPRLFATAVALALTATADPAGDVTAYRPGPGTAVDPADLTTRDGLLAHLATLDPRAHFGDALPAFVAVAAGTIEPFLITHADVLDDPDFQRAMRDAGPPSAYAAAVDRDGSFRLWHLSAAGRRLVRAAKLDLDDVTGPATVPGAVRPKPERVTEAADLPVILSILPFPLQLPLTSVVRGVDRYGDRLFGITADRRLISTNGHATAAVQLEDRLPPGRVACFAAADDRVVALFFGRGPNRQTVYTRVVHRVATGQTVAVALAVPFSPVEAVVRNDVLYLLGRTRALAFDIESSEPIASTSTAGHLRRGGRVYLAPNGKSSLLQFDGSHLALVPVPATSPADKYGYVFEWSGHEGPLVFRSYGQVTAADVPAYELCPGTGRLVTLPTISADGGRLLVSEVSDPTRRWTLDLVTDRKWIPNDGADPRQLLGPSRSDVRAWTPVPVRTRLTGVGVAADGTLDLVTRTGLVSVSLTGPTLFARLATPADIRFSAPIRHPRLQVFGRPFRPPGVGYKLRTATWPDGSRAFLDGRGLLHLKSAERSVPEVTVVLAADRPLAGWSSDGRVYGDRYFHGRDTSCDAKHLDELIRRFTEPLR